MFYYCLGKTDLKPLAIRLRAELKCANTNYGCLDCLEDESAITLIATCLEELQNMRQKEKKKYMTAKVNTEYDKVCKY